MASINTIVKRKQYLWLGIVVVGAASAIGGALYLSDVDMSGNGEAVAEQEPVPDMTGVVDTTFDDKVRQHATTEMQVTAAQMQKGTVAKLAMRQPFVLFKGLTFQKLCLPGAFRPGDHHN
ncbi:hypothetical protein R0799_24170, partial [Escherichia coli]